MRNILLDLTSEEAAALRAIARHRAAGDDPIDLTRACAAAAKEVATKEVFTSLANKLAAMRERINATEH